MESMAHLLADVHPDIPTAVYGARASDPGDTKTTAGADRGSRASSADAETSRAPVEDALRDRVGFRRSPRTSRASPTPLDTSASCSWARACLPGRRCGRLWTAREAKRASDRVAGVVLTLVPTAGRGTPRAFRGHRGHDSTHVRIVRLLGERHDGGGVDDAAAGLFGGVRVRAFRAFVAAKHSDLPSLKEISEARGRFPVLVLADRDAEPAHPVENGRAVAEALGAEFHVAANGAERRRTWPRLVAAFRTKNRATQVSDCPSRPTRPTRPGIATTTRTLRSSSPRNSCGDLR